VSPHQSSCGKKELGSSIVVLLVWPGMAHCPGVAIIGAKRPLILEDIIDCLMVDEPTCKKRMVSHSRFNSFSPSVEAVGQPCRSQ
jgi:hypothetical protein